MLTAEKEAGQIKAHDYWSNRRYGPLHLRFLSEHKAALEPAKIHRYRDRPSVGRRRSTNPHFGRTPPEDDGSSRPEEPFVTVRRFTLSSDDEPFARIREVTQLQYTNWPDFGAPAHPTHLLGLVEQTDAVVRSSYAASPEGSLSEEARPVLVHCSAGCGRTGTFCTVDSVIDMIRRQRAARRAPPPLARQLTPMDLDPPSVPATIGSTFDSQSMNVGPESLNDSNWMLRDDVDLIAKTVEDFRLQRLSMVQSLRQYVLCYESIMEWMAEQTPKSA
jgi:protein tyrosine phosphatase